jgi:hypothetical protein
MTVGDIAAGASAVAAIASCASVWQARQALNAGVRPNLQVDPQAWGVAGDAERRAHFLIHNAGGGIARMVTCLLVTEARYISGPVGIGFVRPGETYRIRTNMPVAAFVPGEPGIVVALDVRGRGHIWDTSGRRVRDWRLRRLRWRLRRHTSSLRDLFGLRYPNFDLTTLEQGPFVTDVRAE